MIQLTTAPESEEWELVRDVETVRSASKELLSLMREIVAAETKLMVAITKAKTLVEKLPIL